MCQSSLHRFAFLGRIISKSTKSGNGNGKGIEVSTPNEHAWIWVYMAYDLRKCILFAYTMLPLAKLINYCSMKFPKIVPLLFLGFYKQDSNHCRFIIFILLISQMQDPN